MSVYPHSWLFVGSARTVDIAGPHIQVLDTVTGNVILSTAAFPQDDRAAVLKSGHIRCAAVDKEFKYLATSGEDKMLKLWELDGLRLLSERELPKKSTSVTFTADAQTILVSDKFGDIFSYPFTYVPLTVKQKKDALSSHENPSGGQLILGHASPLNAFLLTPDEKYIITADRDEHIRVSCYPKGYIIERYCLGHLKFVSAIHIPSSDPQHLISGGGDPMLKIWDWMSGEVKHELPIAEVVEPWVAIPAFKRRRGWAGEEDEEAPAGGKKKKRGKKGKGRAKQEEMEDDAKEGSIPEGEDAAPEKVLVVHKIDSVVVEGITNVVFSAVGTTALFAFPYKTDVKSVDIVFLTFGRPIVDFTVISDGLILVSLDGQWGPEDASAASDGDSSMVRMALMNSGKLVEVSDKYRTLLDALNSSALLISSKDDLKNLDLYGDLTSMPKYTSISDETGEAMDIADGDTPKELSKKELGRMKTKQAVLEILQQQEDEPESKKGRK